MTSRSRPIVSVMLAVADPPTALAWYKQALGATELWNLGSVVGMEIDGAPVFLGEPENNGWEIPTNSVHRRPEWRCSATIRMR